MLIDEDMTTLPKGFSVRLIELELESELNFNQQIAQELEAVYKV